MTSKTVSYDHKGTLQRVYPGWGPPKSKVHEVQSFRTIFILLVQKHHGGHSCQLSERRSSCGVEGLRHWNR